MPIPLVAARPQPEVNIAAPPVPKQMALRRQNALALILRAKATGKTVAKRLKMLQLLLGLNVVSLRNSAGGHPFSSQTAIQVGQK